MSKYICSNPNALLAISAEPSLSQPNTNRAETSDVFILQQNMVESSSVDEHRKSLPKEQRCKHPLPLERMANTKCGVSCKAVFPGLLTTPCSHPSRSTLRCDRRSLVPRASSKLYRTTRMDDRRKRTSCTAPSASELRIGTCDAPEFFALLDSKRPELLGQCDAIDGGSAIITGFRILLAAMA